MNGTNRKDANGFMNSSTNRSKRRLRFLATIPLAGLVLALAGWGMLLARRPPWHTFTLLVPGEGHEVLTIALPDDWEPLPSPMPVIGKSVPTFRILNFRHKPPRGLIRRWIEKVLHQGITVNNSNLYVLVYCFPPGMSLVTLEASMQHMQNYRGFPYTCTLRRFRHPLGPALDVTLIPRRSIAANVRPLMQSHLFYICPQDTPRHRTLLLSINYNSTPERFTALQPPLDEISRRIHLVEGK